ncbi:MAG TPA: serine/threonine-protein kinase [Kofleriaceae bacterium]
MGDGSPLAHSPTLAASTPRDDTQRFVAGAQIGEYVIDRFLGAGAMGEVYAGTHPVIGKRVAIKVLRHELAASAEAAERFVREARATNQIDHENVVDVFAFGRLEDGRLYLVMDLVDGKSLRAALVDGPLEVATALAILDTVADALDAAHAKGVVHRDLKPDNIVLSNATPPKVFVLDFGIAKLVSTANAGDKTGPGTLTGQGTWLGTPGYMAPEQWSVDGAGPASDRYALGVIAFELLSGSLPFSAPSVPGMMEQHFRADVPALSARGAVGVPAALDAVLRRALAKDPEARFPTARAFVAALRVAAGSEARGAVATPGGGRKLWVPAIAGAGVLAIAIVVVLMSRNDRDQPAAAPLPPRDEPTPGVIAIDVSSSPLGAEIKVAGRVRGKTPTKLYAKPGDALELVISKPGYLADTRTLTVEPNHSPLNITLAEITQFTGTWRLANGELRALERLGDQVDVYKVTAGHGGAKTFFKHYAFVPADTGVAFGADDEIVDPRAPNDPHCHVPVHVEYHYDPTTDVLEQLREKVKIGFEDGSCVVESREIEPTKLARVDKVADTVEIPAPVGKPDKVVDKPINAPPTKTVRKKGKTIPLDPKLSAAQQKAADQKLLEANKKQAAVKQKPAANSVGKQAQDPFTKLNDVGAQANQPAPQQQIVPQPQAPAPQVNADDSQQQRQKK